MDKVSILISRVELLLKSGYEKRLNIEELFHWQSQSRTTEESITGQRYINQAVLAMGNERIHLLAGSIDRKLQGKLAG